MTGRAPCSGSPSCYSKCGAAGGAARPSRRYKNIENFLRRMAFNLGNSVSQTDVKILSCIPIDVTDLQQRIIELEKELEEAKGNENGNGKNGKDKKGKQSKDNSDEEKKEDDTKVMMMQMKPPKVEPKLGVGSLPPGPDYVKEYLNVDSKNEVQSLYKAARRLERQVELKQRNAHSTSNTDCASSHRSIQRTKHHKQNPFTVIMGNIKKRKNIECTKYATKVNNQTNCHLDKSGSSYSIVVPHSQKRVNKACPDCKVEKEIDHKNSRYKKKVYKKNEKVYPAFVPHNQYVYYAQTDSHFNPDFKKDNYDCDLTYIANLIEKQYTPMSLFNEKKVLNRQFSVPVCRDSADVLDSKYAISGIGPCSCCPGTASEFDMIRNEGPIQQKYKEYIQTNINGRFNDSTMYDIIPVKQKATKKPVEPVLCNKMPQKVRTRRSPTQLKSFIDIDPPFNLHPTRSLEIMYDTENSKDFRCSNHYERSLRFTNYTKKKRIHSPKQSSPRKPRNVCKTLDPEDIYMTKNLQQAETSSLENNDNADNTKTIETKPNEAVMELKTILHDFLKEIKDDIPKTNESPKTNEPPNTTDKSAHNNLQSYAPPPNPYAFVSSFPQIVQTPQCCCPVLCPLNFIPDAYKAHPPGLGSLPRNQSECYVRKKVPWNDDNSNLVSRDEFSETKKLIKEIYNSMSLQNEEKIENKHFMARDDNVQDHSKEHNEVVGGHKNQNNVKNHVQKEMQTNILNENLSETDSKELTRDSENNQSSTVNTESYVMSVPNTQAFSNDCLKNEKKGKLSSIMKMFKSGSFKKQNEHIESNESIIKTCSYNESTPFKQNVTQFTAVYKDGRQDGHQKSFANHRINTDNPPEDIYKCCYFDREAERLRDFNRASASKPSSNPRHSFRHNEPTGDHSPHKFNSQCFCMPEAHQIPFCLKEIEVKNMGTQSITKRKKLFAILKKLTNNSDTDSDHSYERVRSRPRGQFVAHETQTGTNKKKNSFLQLLKGDKDFDFNEVYNNYNFLDTGKGNVGIKPQSSSYFNKQKKPGKWDKYMKGLDKTKKQDIATRLLNRNPFSFKNMLMKTLIGQKPVANTKPAKAFY